MSHVFAAKICSIRVYHIQWYTYHGGTRVFYNNEPDFNSDKIIHKKWAFIAGAGLLFTTLIGYFLTFVYLTLVGNVPAWIAVFLYINALAYIHADSAYFFVGSLLNFGEVIGVRRTLDISKNLSIVYSFAVLLINVFIGISFLWVK
ncbi:MAG: hypothetical protein ACYDG2_22580 [Ruminiclostridium sp.]